MTSLKIALLLVLAVAKQATSESDGVKKLALANNELAFKLHKTFRQQGNAFTSPTSIFTALAMLYQGARGITAEEIRQVLSFSTAGISDGNISRNFEELLSLFDKNSREYKLLMANAMLSQSQKQIVREYKDTLRRHFRAALREVDFAREGSKIVEEVNNWVKNKTQGKIQKLLSSVDSDTVLLLLNAVYFKGAWKIPFSPRNTREEIFYVNGINGVPVRMMVNEDEFLYGDFNQYGVQAVKLPYSGNHVSMIVLLPLERHGLSRVERDLTASKLDDIISKLEIEDVVLRIPKFKLEDERGLESNLTALGMRSAFTNGANFAGIAIEGNLKVSKILHKAVIEVNEEGSEAAGGTTIGIVTYSLPVGRKFFRADHPFLFFIRDDRTGMILFYGRVNKI